MVFIKRVTWSGTPREIDRPLSRLVPSWSSQTFEKVTGDLHPVLLPSSSGLTLTERLGVCACVCVYVAAAYTVHETFNGSKFDDDHLEAASLRGKRRNKGSNNMPLF